MCPWDPMGLRWSGGISPLGSGGLMVRGGAGDGVSLTLHIVNRVCCRGKSGCDSIVRWIGETREGEI
jgi:hypothetical protein